MRTSRTLAALALLALGTLTTGCGDASDTSDTSDASGDRGTAAEGTATPASLQAYAADDLPTATVPGLLQCAIQSGLNTGGPNLREVGADGVEVPRIRFTATDGSEWDPNSGGLYVFPDAATATARGADAMAAEVDVEYDSEDDTSQVTWSAHGNVVLVTERPVETPPNTWEQWVLDCLPDAAEPTEVAPPAPGTVTVGSLLECLAPTGAFAQGEHTTWDDDRGTQGTVYVWKEYDDWATVSVYPDVEAAQAAVAADVAGERRGNALVELDEALDPAGAEAAAVLGCLPA